MVESRQQRGDWLRYVSLLLFFLPDSRQTDSYTMKPAFHHDSYHICCKDSAVSPLLLNMGDTDSCKPSEKPAPSPANSASEQSRNPLDINSFLPLHETTPESDRVKLTPSILPSMQKSTPSRPPPTPSYTTISC
ncbi:hypothetical protein BJV74DRAFT_247311 [Russula compacta]|nr:hypothetical protein BJV74DRAFT_247311 [Russula compacta]